jgi:ubiquinone/menaquinone biosynthesis C-methylase UbiE
MSRNESSARRDDDTYVLEHVDGEIRRLLLQGRLYDDYTERLLRLAGLQPGMRVLDVGCGPGDVSFVAARLVGSNGTVLGVDSAANIIDIARARAAERGLATVRFEATTIADISSDEPFDAVIGRLILMHLPDPVETLRHLAGLIRPRGLIAFCEPDITAAHTVPDLPLWHAVTDAIGNAFTGAGVNPALGATLHTLFRRAGLGTPRLTLGAALGTADDTDIVAYVVETWRSIFPVAERLGSIPQELGDLDTLTRRLHEEAATAEAIMIMPAMIGAWACAQGSGDRGKADRK